MGEASTVNARQSICSACHSKLMGKGQLSNIDNLYLDIRKLVLHGEKMGPLLQYLTRNSSANPREC